MPKSALSRPYLHDEKAAYVFVESQLWADGRPCPHCGVLDESTALKGKSTRIGVYKCRACRKPFTVKVGTIFESSHIKLHIWLQAIFLLSSSKKGISSNQLSRSLGITLKSAWFLSHRIAPLSSLVSQNIAAPKPAIAASTKPHRNPVLTLIRVSQSRSTLLKN